MAEISKLKSLLSNVGPESCPKHINFHCHTTCSDGSMEPIMLINKAIDSRLQHLAITDHHSIQAYVEITNYFKTNNLKFEKPTLWTGLEITCTLKKCLVHVIALDFDINSNSLNIYTKGESVIGSDLKAESVVKAIHKAGGLAILAHPARYRINYNELLDEAHSLNFDGAEAWYDYSHSETWKPTPIICESINKKLKNLGLLSTCGTDSHGYTLYGR